MLLKLINYIITFNLVSLYTYLLFNQITLDIYYKKGKEKSQLYDDAHDGYDYKKGRYSLRNFKLTGKDKEAIIQQHKEGTFDANYNDFNLVFHNLPFTISSIQVDNVEIPLEHLKTNGKNSITINKEFNELHLFGK